MDSPILASLSAKTGEADVPAQENNGIGVEGWTAVGALAAAAGLALLEWLGLESAAGTAAEGAAAAPKPVPVPNPAPPTPIGPPAPPTPIPLPKAAQNDPNPSQQTQPAGVPGLAPSPSEIV